MALVCDWAAVFEVEWRGIVAGPSCMDNSAASRISFWAKPQLLSEAETAPRTYWSTNSAKRWSAWEKRVFDRNNAACL